MNVLTLGSSNSAAIETTVRVTTLDTQSLERGAYSAVEGAPSSGARGETVTPFFSELEHLVME